MSCEDVGHIVVVSISPYSLINSSVSVSLPGAEALGGAVILS